MRVLWQTQSRLLRDAIAGREPSPPSVGGLAYEYAAAMDLSQSYPVSADDRCVRELGEGHLSYLWKIAAHPNREADTLYVIDPFVLASGKRTRAGKAITIVHHLDTDLMRSAPAWRLFFSVLVYRLKALDRVVAVSQFWKDYLESRGCRNVTVIYNSFDPAEFEFVPDDAAAFRREYGIPMDKPLIYIGKSGPRKGVMETYEALRDRPYTLVTSGPQESDLPPPVMRLDLSRREYLRLLAAADVVTAMSTMPEGWNRVVHEALLSRTPVVGSGSGGMLELLTKGGQLVAESFTVLPERVDRALAEAPSRAEAGYAFAKTLDADYRRAAWAELVRSLWP